MVNIEQSYIVPVGADRWVVVYGDSDDRDRFYIMPEPVMTRDASGLPEFSLVRYESSERQVAGVCRFFVELRTTDDVRERVLAYLREHGHEQPQLGQFDWLQLDPWFSYDVMGKAQLVQGTPSMQGTNRTAFLVTLRSAEEVDSFVTAFTGGALSPFSVEFDVTSLTKLPAVTATITYDAKIAISYETRYEKQKDVWGQEKQIAAEVKQQLRESNAGTVDIDWKAHQPSDETRQRVTDWAWTTLENLVASALTEAQSRAVGNSPVDYTSSFTRTYSENQLVEWTFSTSRPCPRTTRRHGRSSTARSGSAS